MPDKLAWCEWPGCLLFPCDSVAPCDDRKPLRADGSMWLMVFARGLMLGFPMLPRTPTLLDTEFLRTRAEELGGSPVVLSLRPLRGREEVAPWACNFC